MALPSTGFHPDLLQIGYTVPGILCISSPVSVMNKNVERAKELVPAIILTILSMIQALALELFWSKIEASSFLWAGGWDAAIGWLQMAVVLVGILLIWVFYVSFVLRFSWLPTLEDTLIPFLIGLLEFAMIDITYPHLLGPWFLVLALVYGITTATTHVTMRRARRDPANEYFFSKTGPASWRDYRATVSAVSILAVTGVVLWVIESNHYFSLGALLIALFAMFYQFIQSKRYWMHSLVMEEAGPESAPGDEE